MSQSWGLAVQESTFLNLLGGLDSPTAGEYFIGDRNVAQLTDNELSAIRAERIGFVFQAYNLLPQLDVVENVEVLSLPTTVE